MDQEKILEYMDRNILPLLSHDMWVIYSSIRNSDKHPAVVIDKLLFDVVATLLLTDQIKPSNLYGLYKILPIDTVKAFHEHVNRQHEELRAELYLKTRGHGLYASAERRILLAELNAVFTTFIGLIHGKVGQDVGCYHLLKTRDGYIIAQYTKPGELQYPLGERPRKIKELYHTLGFAIQAIERMKK